MGQIDDLQKRAWNIKVKNGFDKTTADRDMLLAYGEMAEVFDAYRKELEDLDEELADVVIYIMGLAEKLGVSLEEAVFKKLEKVEKRKWKKIKEGHYEKYEGNE